MAKTAVMKVWDVELGLAIHIAAPNGKYIVIDLGSKAGVSPLRSLLLKTVGFPSLQLAAVNSLRIS